MHETQQLIDAYSARHGGDGIGPIIWLLTNKRDLPAIVVSEHFLHGQTIADSARLVGVSPQAANKMCALFRHAAILFCQENKMDPEKSFIPLIKASSSDLVKMLNWWVHSKMQDATLAPEPEPPSKAGKSKKR